jgi:hypothetical protein
MARSKYLMVGAVCWLFSLPCLAGQLTANDNGTTVWQAGIDGPRIEWNTDGSISRIYSRYSQPVAFPDRQGIMKAQIIAEEKAKAAIIRFLDQDVASARVATEIQNDMNQSTMTKGGGQGGGPTKTSQRQMIENLSEVTSSAAAGRLRGVIVLERGYDDKDEVAWVEVGISQKTIAASRALNNAINGNPAISGGHATSGSPVPEGNSTLGGDDTVRLPGSEVQTSPQKNW